MFFEVSKCLEGPRDQINLCRGNQCQNKSVLEPGAVLGALETPPECLVAEKFSPKRPFYEKNSLERP